MSRSDRWVTLGDTECSDDEIVVKASNRASTVVDSCCERSLGEDGCEFTLMRRVLLRVCIDVLRRLGCFHEVIRTAPVRLCFSRVVGEILLHFVKCKRKGARVSIAHRLRTFKPSVTYFQRASCYVFIVVQTASGTSWL